MGALFEQREVALPTSKAINGGQHKIYQNKAIGIYFVCMFVLIYWCSLGVAFWNSGMPCWCLLMGVSHTECDHWPLSLLKPVNEWGQGNILAGCQCVKDRWLCGLFHPHSCVIVWGCGGMTFWCCVVIVALFVDSVKVSWRSLRNRMWVCPGPSLPVHWKWMHTSGTTPLQRTWLNGRPFT